MEFFVMKDNDYQQSDCMLLFNPKFRFGHINNKSKKTYIYPVILLRYDGEFQDYSYYKSSSPPKILDKKTKMCIDNDYVIEMWETYNNWAYSKSNKLVFPILSKEDMLNTISTLT